MDEPKSSEKVLGRRALIIAGAVGTALPIPAAFAMPSPQIISEPRKSWQESAGDDGWENWLSTLLLKAHRSRRLTRKGWVPDKAELGIAWLRVIVPHDGGELGFGLHPQGKDPHIRIEWTRDESALQTRLEMVEGDWQGEARKCSQFLDTKGGGSAGLFGWTKPLKRPAHLQNGAPSKGTMLLREDCKGPRRHEYFSLIDEYHQARHAAFQLRSSLRYKRLLLPLAETIDLMLPERLQKWLEFDESESSHVLNQRYRDLNGQMLAFERRYRHLIR